MDRDTRWENVFAYMGQIRHYNPDNWMLLKQEDLFEFLIEVRIDGQVVGSRHVVELIDIADCQFDLVKLTLDTMVKRIDEELEKKGY